MPPIVFFGSSQFSVVVLQKVLSAKCKVLSIVTTKDKPVGRHLKLTPNPVKLLAQKHNILVIEDIRHLTLDFKPSTIGLVAAYGRIIPKEVLDKFGSQIFNIHPSLLPKFRGPSPLQTQILEGVTDTGVTIIKLDVQMDHGPIVATSHDTILPDDTWITLGTRLFAKGADLFLSLDIKHLTLNIQNDASASFTKKLSRQDGFLPWPEFTKFDYDRKFRAYFDWPGIWSIDPTGLRVKLVSTNPIMIQSEGQKPKPYDL